MWGGLRQDISGVFRERLADCGPLTIELPAH
jgi:hypothetical protein